MAITYGIERSTNGINYTEIAEVSDVLTYVDSGAPIGDLYYRVRKKSPNSNYSNVATVTTVSDYDPDAQAWIDRMTSPTLLEQQSINTFVIAEKADGNWSLYDEFYCFCFGDTNSLIGAKSKTATAFGGLTWTLNGMVTNMVNSYVNTDFNPSVDGVNYTQDDAQAGVFIYANDTSDNFVSPFGDINNGSRILGVNQVQPGSTSFAINSGQQATASQLLDQGLYQCRREALNVSTGLKDGVQIATFGAFSVGVPVGDIFVGGLNSGGSLVQPIDATISTFVIGGSVGFDYPAHNTNVRQLLTDLGVTL